MIAVVVSSHNRCYYCMVSHSAAVRKISKDPILGELLVMNYRAADLSNRHLAMLDFAWKLTENPDKITDADREHLKMKDLMSMTYGIYLRLHHFTI